MKYFYTKASNSRVFSLFCITLLFLIPISASQSLAENRITASYADATITEDVTWHGTVLVRGSLVVAPQTTLRIEPGTVIRFSAARHGKNLPRLVVQGRIQAIGTSERPILFAPNLVSYGKGDWGGVLLLSSEKRNVIEHSSIEGAEIGLEARFSTFTARSLSVNRSTSGCVLRDSTATLLASTLSSCNTALEAHDSELELKEGTISANRRGMLLYRTAVVMSSLVLRNNSEQAVFAEECRLKFTSNEISDNVGGAQIIGGEGQIFLTRFVRNRETALHLSKSRLKVSRCMITGNIRAGLYLEDNRATFWGNAISDNGGFNLIYAGREALTIVQNWWGSHDEAVIAAKISNTAASVAYSPWLAEKPPIYP